MAAAPSARRASPSARGRSRRRATDGGGTQPTPETSVASQPATGLGTPTVQPTKANPAGSEISSAWPGVHGCGSLRAARIPIRQRPVAATDHGRRRREREARYATEPAHQEVSPGAPAPRACRLRVAIPLEWPPADVPGAPLRAPPCAMYRTRHEMLIGTHRLSLSALAICRQLTRG